MKSRGFHRRIDAIEAKIDAIKHRQMFSEERSISHEQAEETYRRLVRDEDYPAPEDSSELKLSDEEKK